MTDEKQNEIVKQKNQKQRFRFIFSLSDKTTNDPTERTRKTIMERHQQRTEGKAIFYPRHDVSWNMLKIRECLSFAAAYGSAGFRFAISYVLRFISLAAASPHPQYRPSEQQMFLTSPCHQKRPHVSAV